MSGRSKRPRWLRGHGRGAALVFVIVLLVGSLPTLLDAVPPPSTPDEFAYLLAADTLAHNRLTNPPHLFREHFETLHVLVTPTYASKYPPAQGFMLALGRALAGEPVIGAVLTVALASAATTWMLRAWMRSGWAIPGGLVAGLHLEVFAWGQNYLGAAIPMLGSALLCGAAARALRRASARHGVVAGVGLAILANSRPFDGLLIALLVLGWVVIAGLRDKRLLDIIQRTMPACLLVLAPVIAWMGYYNFRVTGNALQLPYTLYARQYQVAPLFYFQRPRPVPEYRHARLAEYWTGYDLQEWQRQSTLNGWVRGAVTQIATLVRAFFAPPTLWAAIIALPLALRRHRACRAAAAVLALFILLHVVLTPWMRMHYMGAAAPLFFAVITFSLIELSRRAIGTLLAGLILLVQASAVVTLIAAMSANPHPAGAARARIVSDLHRLPGEHLVVVSYGAGPQHLFEWVYNDADLDGSRILFARDMGEAPNRRLLDHFASRRVWRLHVDGNRYDFSEIGTDRRGAR